MPTMMTESSSNVSHRAGDLGMLADQLFHEFGAPVGLFDPVEEAWLATVKAEPGRFPRVDAKLWGVLAARGFSPSSVAVVQLEPETGPLWLALPIQRPGGVALVALIGFAASASANQNDKEGWGPVCPQRALQAWGQNVADQLFANRVSQTSSGRIEQEGGGERLLIARLIRRLKISDHPERFQNMALAALKDTMNVEAVAWVPSQHHEPVILCGEVAGLNKNTCHALISPSKGDAVFVNNQPAEDSAIDLKRIAAVASDRQGQNGWLLALNPLDGRPFQYADVELLQPVASLIAAQQINARHYADLKELLFGIIRALTSAIDAKDTYTSGHSERVARIAVRLGQELGMSDNQRSDLYLMGLLHDVGKIGIDDKVLKKTGPLTPDEYRIIQSHVEIGVHILKDLRKLSHLIPGIKHHHESLDGTGYPSKLAGDAIPLEARILAVADSFDAMSSTRPYRKMLSSSQIDEILRKGSGVQWDPKVIDALAACRMDVEAILEKERGDTLKKVVINTLGRH